MRKRVAILGSTGSIGTQALDVIARHLDEFEVVGLAAGHNVELLREQTLRFSPKVATTAQDGAAGLLRVAVESEPEILLAATDGSVAFEAVFAAVARGIDVAVANKELIVAAGELLVDAARRSGSHLLPVDSEHSAIFQCLVGEDRASVAAIVLTASGGPFWRMTREAMEEAGIEAALTHPTWRMGRKNTIDSATMMNKGLEVIEASRLFGFPGDQIRIVVHPQSVAHGFVVFTDGSVKGQLAAPDMRLPIGYALSYPKRLSSFDSILAGPVAAGAADRLSSDGDGVGTRERKAGVARTTSGVGAAPVLEALGAKSGDPALRFDFEPSDPQRFPCIRLAYEALAAGGTRPAVLSAANEVAVEAFVEGRVGFGRIPDIIGRALDRAAEREPTLDGVRAADREARDIATEFVEHIERSSRR